MKVIQVGKFYPPEYQGGLEAVVELLNNELVRRGVEVTVVVAGVRGARRETRAGVDVVRLKSLGTILSQPLVPSLARAVREAGGDVVHLHRPNPLADALVPVKGAPLVVTHHSEIVRQRLLWPLYRPMARRALGAARRIAIGSEQLLRTSRELKGFESKTRVIPFGIDASRFAPTPAIESRARELRERRDGRPAILAVGRLVGYKGFDVLVEAAKDLEAVVVIVGRGPEEAHLRALAGANVVFAGHVEEPDLLAHYHACDAFCLPSVTIAEAFGMVLLEAMACGKPLVTTRLPTGVSAINRDGTTGLSVPPRDVGALREALRALVNDASLRRRLGDAGRAVQQSEYTAALMGERYLSLYHEALGG